MKKILFLILLLITLTGCKNKEMEIKTIINNDSDHLITITYPITNIKKLDKVISNYISDKIKNKSTELNIDYTLNVVSDRYINISLETYQNTNNNNSYDIKTYIFDKKKNKFLKLNNLISENSISTINQKIIKETSLEINYNYELVTFDENNIYFYFNNKNNITKVNVPTHDLEILLDIILDNKMKKEYNSYNTKKIIDPKKPVVALTFDDGPSKYTDDILNILIENDANATFFVLGNKVKYYSQTLNKMINSGNEIGNHTYNHKSLSSLKIDEILYQISTTQDIIYETTGYTPIYLRPSYGNTNSILKEKTPLEIILWTVDPEDWKYKNSKTIANRVIKKTKDGSIILLHDTKKRTIKAIEIIIKELKEKEFQFVTISELKEVQDIRKRIGIN